MKTKKKVHTLYEKPAIAKIIIVLLVFLVLPITIIAVLQVQNLQQNAAMLGTSAYSAHQDTQTVPFGCQAIACTIACPMNNPNCCPVRYTCPSGTPSACMPRPACLDANPPCEPPIPQGGWCPSGTPTSFPVTPAPQISCIPAPPCLKFGCLPPVPIGGWCAPAVTPPITSITPPSDCFIQGIFTICPKLNTNPQQCSFHPTCRDIGPQCGIPDHIGACPVTSVTVTLTPAPTCIPRPSCLDQNPACALPQPAGGWCPSTNQTVSSSSITAIMIYLNTFLRNLLGRR